MPVAPGSGEVSAKNTPPPPAKPTFGMQMNPVQSVACLMGPSQVSYPPKSAECAPLVPLSIESPSQSGSLTAPIMQIGAFGEEFARLRQDLAQERAERRSLEARVEALLSARSRNSDNECDDPVAVSGGIRKHVIFQQQQDNSGSSLSGDAAAGGRGIAEDSKFDQADFSVQTIMDEETVLPDSSALLASPGSMAVRRWGRLPTAAGTHFLGDDFGADVVEGSSATLRECPSAISLPEDGGTEAPHVLSFYRKKCLELASQVHQRDAEVVELRRALNEARSAGASTQFPVQ